MESSENGTKDPQDLQERRIYYPVSNTKQMVFNQLTTLPLQFKLVLYACLSLLSQDKKDIKVTVADVFLEYKKLATELHIEWMYIGKVSDLIKELEMLGFLKCKYVRKDRRQIKYVHVLDAAEMPKYVSVLQEELRKVRVDERIEKFEEPKKATFNG